MEWIAYNQLAWTDEILAPPESYEEEVGFYVHALKKHITVPNPTMLHLGCGAGGHDYYFKQHFSVTGVDLSEGMLRIAKNRNPEITYIQGDMRTVELLSEFDAVVIPDSIAYMTTLEDLAAVLENAAAHLKPQGVLLVVAHTKEEFRNNNFVYTGENHDTHLTLFENNWIVSDSTYEAVMVYLIRRNGELSIQHEVHTLGLFSEDQWRVLLEKHSFEVDASRLDHLYDSNLMEDGEYPLTVFMGKKSG